MAVPMLTNLYGSGVAPSAARTADGAGNLIPAFWSRLINITFYRSTTFGSFVNRYWEGEIKNMGDTVYIRERPHFNIDIVGPGDTPAYGSNRDNYVPGIGVKRRFDRAMMNTKRLTIDYEAQWGIRSDDVIVYQADIDYMREFVDGCAADMAVAIDKELIQLLPPLAHANNKGATAGNDSASFNLGTTSAPVTLTPRNILDFVSDLGTIMDEQSVPLDDRFVVFTPGLSGVIRKSDLRNASFSGDGSSMFKNGNFGMLSDMTLYMSRSLATGTQSSKKYHQIIFGQRSAISFAAQFDRVEGPMRDIEYDGDFYKGKSLFGFKVVKPEALGSAVVFTEQ